jgi:hypothetical protein
MSYKDAVMTLDMLYYELAMLQEAKDNCETYEDLIDYEVQMAELELEIEQVESFYLKYI